jgi:hypothetical protein
MWKTFWLKMFCFSNTVFDLISTHAPISAPYTYCNNLLHVRAPSCMVRTVSSPPCIEYWIMMENTALRWSRFKDTKITIFFSFTRGFIPLTRWFYVLINFQDTRNPQCIKLKLIHDPPWIIFKLILPPLGIKF